MRMMSLTTSSISIDGPEDEFPSSSFSGRMMNFHPWKAHTATVRLLLLPGVQSSTTCVRDDNLLHWCTDLTAFSWSYHLRVRARGICLTVACPFSFFYLSLLRKKKRETMLWRLRVGDLFGYYRASRGAEKESREYHAHSWRRRRRRGGGRQKQQQRPPYARQHKDRALFKRHTLAL